MAKVYKPKQPLIKDGGYLFPRTTVDQVYFDAPTGKMLDAKIAEMDSATVASAEAAEAAGKAANNVAEEVANVTAITSGAATLDDTNTTGGNVGYCKYGQLVQVNVYDLRLKVSAINARAWSTFTVATGLPAPAGGSTAYEHLYIECALSNAGRFRVTVDGQLEFYHHDDTLVRGSFEDAVYASGIITYIAAK